MKWLHEIEFMDTLELFSDLVTRRPESPTRNTLVEDINPFRHKNLSAHHLAHLIHRTEDPV